MEETLSVRLKYLPPTYNVMCRCAEMAREQDVERLAWARFPRHHRDEGPATFDNFNARAGTVDALAMAREFAEGKAAESVQVFVGRTGRGKSHLVEAMGRRMLERGLRVRYESVPDLVDRVRSHSPFTQDGEPPEPDPFQELRRADVLILDDVGAERPTKVAVETLFKIVDDRIRNGGPKYMLVIASNEDRDGLAADGGERLASRIFDSRSGAVRGILITASDYRDAGR